MQSRDKQRRKKHLSREKTDWKKFQKAVQTAWIDHLQDVGVTDSENGWENWITELHSVNSFLVENFKQYKDPDPLDKPLGQANSLVLWPRRRLRAKFHVFITCQPNFGFVAEKDDFPAAMYSDNPFLTERALLDAIRMVCGMDYVLTLSAPRAGPSVHGMHFQAMPKQLRIRNCSPHNLFSWLDAGITTPNRNSTLILKGYPAVSARISGEQDYVAESIWYLASNYNRLMSYNLIILRINQEKTKTFFFPRPFSPDWEGPQEFKPTKKDPNGWAFGAFEMGGFFMVGDKIKYQSICDKNRLDEYLKETTINYKSDEMKKFYKLISNLET